MKHRFMLTYTFADGEAPDEQFAKAHNVTEARKIFLGYLDPDDRPIGLFQSVKNKGWVEKDLGPELEKLK